MVDVRTSPQREYINVMEILVAEEVEQQLRQLPSRVLKYVKAIEVETYALNRLPSLYAVSEKGWQSQYHKAKYDLRKEISNAVRQAIAAVQIDPLRSSRPLPRRPSAAAVNADLLDQFRIALGQPNLTWDSLLRKCKRAGAARRGTDSAPMVPSSGGDAYGVNSSYPPEPAGGPHHRASEQRAAVHHHRPGTYGDNSWHPKHSHAYTVGVASASSQDYDWNDSRYR